MKNDISPRIELRTTPAMKKYLLAAARADRRNLSQFLIHAACLYGETLIQKQPPAITDRRHKGGK
jgi:uncharacterized protein (DUF1778 family)